MARLVLLELEEAGMSTETKLLTPLKALRTKPDQALPPAESPARTSKEGE